MSNNNQLERWSPMNNIYGSLYLGNYESTSANRPFIGRHNIRNILTVMNTEIQESDRQSGVQYYYIEANDSISEDLLTRFPEAYAIIDTAVTAGTGILVHCAAGISRSATIVISYLMKKLQKSCREMTEFVRSKRSVIYPNAGFVQQLLLWEAMGYTLDANNCRFRHYLQKKYILDNFYDLTQFFEKLSVAERMAANLSYGAQYVCTGCGQKLFNEIHVLKNDGSIKYNGIKKCGRLFIEPQTWMTQLITPKNYVNVNEKDIKCQKCGQVVVKCTTINGGIECKCGQHKDLIKLNLRVIDRAVRKL